LNSQHGSRAGWQWCVFLAVFLILPNLPLLLAGRALNLLMQGYFDLDYFVIALFALFLPRALTFLLLLLAVVADFVHAACATYLFSPSEFVNSIRFGGMLSTTRAALMAGTLASVVMVCLLAMLCIPRSIGRGQRRVAAAALLVLLLLIVPSIQAMANHGRLLSGDEDVSTAMLIRVPSLSLIQRQWIYERYRRGERLEGMFAMPSASAIALGHLRDFVPRGSADPAGQNELPNFVQILVESWGWPKDDALRKALLAPYSDPKVLARYRVLEGAAPFEGPTTSGEFRELCQTHIGYNISHGSVEQMQHCLPMRLRGMGYSTLAVHGFRGAMFDRNVWYPQMGFQDIWFEERLRALGMPECDGPFPGTCDASVATWVGDRLTEPRSSPLFVHWVTLNSHLPVPIPAPLKNAAPCTVSAATRADASLCSWYQLVAVVQESVSAMALKQLNKPTIFVIVGDHAPPFDRQEIRGKFSSTEVPYVVLLPKASGGGSLSGD
jgi:hypothetical protein